MGLFSKLFGSNNQVSKVDSVLIQQLAAIESMLQNQGDFIGVFGTEDREALEILCNKQESSFSYLNLALIHIYGINVPKDYDKGEELLLQSVALDNPFAYKYLALIEEEIKHNLDKAIAYLKKGADVGDEAAMTNLAGYYMEGHGVPLNRNKAIKLWEKAASLGDDSAAKNLQRAGA